MTRLQGNNPNRMILVIGTLIAAALIALALFAVRGKPAVTANSTNFNLADLPYSGQESAPVNVVIVEDLKCPACKQFEEAVFPELKTKYADTGKVKLYSLIWPFLAQMPQFNLSVDDGKWAAQAGKCVYDQGGNAAFESFKSIIFRAQGDEREAWATKARLKELTANVEGVDQAKFATCLDNDETAARVDADEKQANDAGVTGTPSVFVNGKKVDATLEAISKAIDEATQ